VPVSPVMPASNSPVIPRKRSSSPLVLAGGAFAGGLVIALLKSQIARGAVRGADAIRRRTPLSSRRRRILAALGR